MSEDLVLNWGIVSAGLICQDFATTLYQLKSDKHVLKAVAARKLEDASKFAARFEIANHYCSYDALFADPDVNIVYVGSITSAHKDLCIRAMKAGKHVLCEKTMCVDSAEQEEILSTAKTEKRFFMEAIWTRFFPLVERLRTELKNKTIGEVKFYNGNFMVLNKTVERIASKEMGGGALLDLGIYPIQLACLVFDHEKPIKVTAAGHLMPSGVDECCTIILTFSNNRIAQINISSNCGRFSSTFIVGEGGVMTIPNSSGSPTELVISQHTSITSEHKVTKIEEPLPNDGGTYNYSNSVGLRFQAEACRQAIAQGKLEHPYVTHDMSRLFMHIIDEARRQL